MTLLSQGVKAAVMRLRRNEMREKTNLGGGFTLAGTWLTVNLLERFGTERAGWAILDEFLQRNPRVKFHFTPTYSSWLTQVEIWFARLEREVIARGAKLGAEADALHPSLFENCQAF
jgi:hypothetical protein